MTRAAPWSWQCRSLLESACFGSISEACSARSSSALFQRARSTSRRQRHILATQSSGGHLQLKSLFGCRPTKDVPFSGGMRSTSGCLGSSSFAKQVCARTLASAAARPTRVPVEKADIKVLLANKYDYEKMKPDPTGYWISEKLDGVRVVWNGEGQLLSRLGTTFAAPQEFTQWLPEGMQLDGELFLKRNAFSDTVSIVRSLSERRWDEITFMVFDIPSESARPFEERIAHLKKLFPGAPTFEVGGPIGPKNKESVTLLDQVECKGPGHLTEMLERVQQAGGEGLMLRKPKSKYEFKRSSTLLKVKTFYDAEAVVVGYAPGKGKYQGLTGSLVCKMERGAEFSVGSGLTDAERHSPPPIGSIVTYRFQELTKAKLPRFPTFVGIAADKDVPKDAEIDE